MPSSKVWAGRCSFPIPGMLGLMKIRSGIGAGAGRQGHGGARGIAAERRARAYHDPPGSGYRLREVPGAAGSGEAGGRRDRAGAGGPPHGGPQHRRLCGLYRPAAPRGARTGAKGLAQGAGRPGLLEAVAGRQRRCRADLQAGDRTRLGQGARGNSRDEGAHGGRRSAALDGHEQPAGEIGGRRIRPLCDLLPRRREGSRGRGHRHPVGQVGALRVVGRAK